MLFSRGRRLFSVASILLVVVAGLHTMGHFSPAPAGDSAFTTMEGAMRGYVMPMGLGMSPSFWDLARSLSLTMSITYTTIGLLGLLLASSRDATPRLLSRVAALIAGATGALTVLYAVYRVPPPLISMVVITVLFTLAVRTTDRA